VRVPKIDHVVVLVLENRSFDHLLGFLNHPDPTFKGLSRGGPYSNPGWLGWGKVTAATGAKRGVPVGPDHSHDAVMDQLAVVGGGTTRKATNTGFVRSYERKGRGLDPPEFGGLLGGLLDVWAKAQGLKGAVKGRGPLAMLSQDPDHVPVLKALALSFRVCDQWFSSVPGETWPNRNFVHAATSHGETDIQIQPYYDKSIFQVLEDNEANWHIYHDDTPQVWAFPDLWDTPERHARWFEFKHFADHVKANSLPEYSFIEPNHRPPIHTIDHDPPLGSPDVSDSQHPENNMVKNQIYDSLVDTANCDFGRAESLIANVYEALRASPEVFERTLLVVTYDEHGGLYDHLPPEPTCYPRPIGASSSDGEPSDPALGALARAIRFFYRRKAEPFDFKMLGVRVPAVVISPYVSAGKADHGIHDHASVPATLHALFAPEADFLTDRDRAAVPLHGLADLAEPRRDEDLPNLSQYAQPAVTPASPTAVDEDEIPPHYKPFVEQAKLVHKHLEELGELEAQAPLRDPRHRRATAAEVSRRFVVAAERHRRELGGR
jgi:phospholipase C